MKRLLIMRHAKTESPEIFRSDFVRNLTINGQDHAYAQGKFLSILPFQPQLILVSPSNRTIQTLDNLLPASLWEDVEVKVQDNLYHANINTLLKTINEMDDSIDDLMIVGHNFGVLELVQHYSSGFINQFKPGTLTLFHFETNHWKETEPEIASNIYLKSPSDE